MISVKRKIKRLKKKRQFHFSFFGSFYKVFLRQRRLAVKNNIEIIENKGVFWHKVKIPLMLLLVNNKLFSVLKVGKVPNARRSTNSEFNQYCTKLIDNLNDNKLIYTPWKETLDIVFWSRIWPLVDKKLKNSIDEVMNALELPLTGSHGDFNPNNLLVNNCTGEYYLIDWDNFRKTGSVVQDIWQALCRDIFGIWDMEITTERLKLLEIHDQNTGLTKNTNTSIKQGLLLFSFAMMRSDNVMHNKTRFEKRIRDCLRFINQTLELA